MLEIKDLKKVYVAKGKGGATTNALDGVSIKFPETGMVFLLGKSGSGKSTLLNVCGGLDTPTSGEIIVKGRSSKDFSKSDFDSYRNTFIGFIFQEYNILDEFSVEDNIALALELQGKKKDKKKIAQLLEDVDLKEFAKRKPNTLSGGQKQRIAIARALIKEPEIIMADEPTGALDSNTGKQVLDTLKKLSETKLVIVVSHDRDFAEYYGDRIIELKDGKILSDVTKGHTIPNKAGNITIIDDENIMIKSGSELQEADLKTLNAFLKNSNKEIFISKGEQEIDKYKAIAQISNDGGRDKFDQTDESKYAKKEYKKEDSKFIKSRLPAHHAFKIGTSNLKVKPMRLFFTELLTIGSLVLLGVFSTMMFYNKTEVAVSSLMESDEYLNITKKYRVIETYEGSQGWERVNSTKVSDSDIEQFDKYGEVVPYYNFSNGEWFNMEQLSIENSGRGQSKYYKSAFSGFIPVKPDSLLRESIKWGGYPSDASGFVISHYTYESLKANSLKDETEHNIILESENDIIGKTIFMRGEQFKVTGVFDIPNLISAKYDALKDASGSSNGNLEYNFDNEMSHSLAAMAMVHEDFYDNYKDRFQDKYEKPEGFYTDGITLGDQDKPIGNYYLVDEFSSKKLYSLKGEENNLVKDDNTVYMPIGNYSNVFSQIIDSDETMDRSKLYVDVTINGKTMTADSALRKFEQGFDEPEWSPDNKEPQEPVRISDEERLAYLKAVVPMLEEMGVFEKFKGVQFLLKDSIYEPTTVNVGGFYFVPEYGDCLIMSQANVDKYKRVEEYQGPTLTTKYEVDKNATIDGLLVHNPRSHDQIKELVDGHYNWMANDAKFQISNGTLDTLDMANNMIEMFTQIFLYVGIALAVFASLLLFNFISVSISNKKREIGILRAVGARGTDVFKIFFSESFIITLIAAVIGLVAAMFTTGIINHELAEGLSGVVLLVFGWKSIALVVAISAIVMLVSTWLPVYFIAKKKPVDSIRSL